MDQLECYKSQLLSVDQALQHAQGEQNLELLDLKCKLQEVIALLQGEQKCSRNTDTVESSSPMSNDLDDEFAQFQMEMKALGGGVEGSGGVSKKQEQTVDIENGEENEEEEETSKEIANIVTSLEGTKCSAPFMQPWGEKDYYNALIISVDQELYGIQSAEDIQVKVMFCNPVCDQMRPCSFFLSGHCKFSEEKCRFSHGHTVNFLELREFVLPDFSKLSVDAKCHAKGSDGLWQKATVEKCLKDNLYSVKFDRSGKTDTLEVENVLPLDNPNFQMHYDECDSSSLSEVEQFDNGSLHMQVPQTSDRILPLGLAPCSTTWEQHTRGIGSKLMEKMGHVWGQGLGKNSDGRLDPVEAVILPTGKSLDKCIEMRDQCNPKGPVSVESRLALAQDKEEQNLKKARTYSHQRRKQNVFDFINSKISKVRDERQSFSVRKSSMSHKEASNKNLNVQVFSVGEDIRKAKKELCKLRQSLQRNSERNEAIRVQVEKKIATQSDILQSLQAKELKIIQDIKSQSSQKKLTVF